MRPTRAFTYVELTIVLTIIAILAAIAIPNFLEAQTRSCVSRSRAEMTVIKAAIESYRIEQRHYPLNAKAGEWGTWDLAVLTSPIPYLGSLPKDVMTTDDARGRRHARPIQPIPYHYLNGIQMNPDEGIHFEGEKGNDAPSLGDGFISAMLWGLGPGNTLPLVAPSPFTKIGPKGELIIRAYDPSNGTVSYGDLYLRVP